VSVMVLFVGRLVLQHRKPGYYRGTQRSIKLWMASDKCHEPVANCRKFSDRQSRSQRPTGRQPFVCRGEHEGLHNTLHGSHKPYELRIAAPIFGRLEELYPVFSLKGFNYVC
jgi:hypothetical protein